MIILGAVIETGIIKGIGQLSLVREGSNAWYKFDLITAGGIVEFRSDVIEDVAIATKEEQRHLHDFKAEYQYIRNEVAHLINEGQDQFEYHAYKVTRAYEALTTGHLALEAMIAGSKSKAKDEWLRILKCMAPHIITLKNLAGHDS